MRLQDIVDVAARAEDNIGKRESVKMFESDFAPQLLEPDSPIIEDRRSSKYSAKDRKMSERSDYSVSSRMERGSMSSNHSHSFAYKVYTIDLHHLHVLCIHISFALCHQKQFGGAVRRKHKGKQSGVLKRMMKWTK